MQNGETKGGASAPGTPSPGPSRGMVLDPVGCSWTPWDVQLGPGAPKTRQGGRIHLIQGLIPGWDQPAAPGTVSLPVSSSCLAPSCPSQTPPSVREKRKTHFPPRLCPEEESQRGSRQRKRHQSESRGQSRARGRRENEPGQWRGAAAAWGAALAWSCSGTGSRQRRPWPGSGPARCHLRARGLPGSSRPPRIPARPWRRRTPRRGGC